MKTKIIRMLLILGTLLCIGLFTSCDLDEPAYNQNYQIEWEGEDPEFLWLKVGSHEWQQIPNDGSSIVVEFDIQETTEGYKTYDLKFTAEDKIDAVYFNGFYNIVYDEDGNAISSATMEMDFDERSNKYFRSSGRLLEQERYNVFVTRYD